MSVLPADISGKPTVISTFAGTGGSSLGYHWAGFKELLAIDFDDHAVECFKLNFPDVPVWNRDIKTVSGQEILDFCKIDKGELDVFDGSPPCQGFSTAGKREVRDERNDLFKEYKRLIVELQPKVFVIENVSGMIKDKMKGRFNEIMKELKDTGYNVKAKLMNAMYYGVPQSRQRIFFIGSIASEPEFPTPNTKPISVKDALNRDGKIVYRHNYSKGKCSFAESSFSKPCLTITKLRIGWDVQPQDFSIADALLLCSFPSDWKLIGSYDQQWARLGNAVMPKQMEAIARTIKEKMLNV